MAYETEIITGVFTLGGAAVGAIITYFVEKKLKESEWKREISNSRLMFIYNPLLIELDGIKVNLEKFSNFSFYDNNFGWTPDAPLTEWEKINKSPILLSILKSDDEVYNLLVEFYEKSLKDYNEQLKNVKKKLIDFYVKTALEVLKDGRKIKSLYGFSELIGAAIILGSDLKNYELEFSYEDGSGDRFRTDEHFSSLIKILPADRQLIESLKKRKDEIKSQTESLIEKINSRMAENLLIKK